MTIEIENALQGDADSSITFEWVGRCLTQWELMENSMSFLCMVLVGGGTQSFAGKHAFSAISSGRGRSEIIKNIANFLFSAWLENDNSNLDPSKLKEIQKSFKAIMKNYDMLSNYRNAIAHGIVEKYKDGRFFLLPPHHNTKRRPSGEIPKYALGAFELRAYEHEFNLLKIEVFSVAHAIMEWKIQSDNQRKIQTNRKS